MGSRSSVAPQNPGTSTGPGTPQSQGNPNRPATPPNPSNSRSSAAPQNPGTSTGSGTPQSQGNPNRPATPPNPSNSRSSAAPQNPGTSTGSGTQQSKTNLNGPATSPNLSNPRSSVAHQNTYSDLSSNASKVTYFSPTVEISKGEIFINGQRGVLLKDGKRVYTPDELASKVSPGRFLFQAVNAIRKSPEYKEYTETAKKLNSLQRYNHSKSTDTAKLPNRIDTFALVRKMKNSNEIYAYAMAIMSVKNDYTKAYEIIKAMENRGDKPIEDTVPGVQIKINGSYKRKTTKYGAFRDYVPKRPKADLERRYDAIENAYRKHVREQAKNMGINYDGLVR